MAVPSAVAKSTVTGDADAADRLTVKVARPGVVALPSAKETLLMAIVGGAATSSLTIVPTALPSAMVAPVADDRASLSVSVASTAVSPETWMLTTFEISPAAKVSLPDCAA